MSPSVGLRERDVSLLRGCQLLNIQVVFSSVVTNSRSAHRWLANSPDSR